MAETGLRRLMDEGRLKCVVVLAEELLRGLAVNTPNVLSFTLGSELGEIVGSAVMDGSGEEHLEITDIPIPELTAGELGHDGIFAVAAWRINRRGS